MEWNLIKAYMMDWKNKRHFLMGDTFVYNYVHPTIWQLLELFGDGSYSNLSQDNANYLRWQSWAPFTVRALVDMQKPKPYNRHSDLLTRQIMNDSFTPDMDAWSYMMGLAYDAEPVISDDGIVSVPTTPYCEKVTGLAGGSPAWDCETPVEVVSKVDTHSHSVMVERVVNKSHLNGTSEGYEKPLERINKHVLHFNPQRQVYAGSVLHARSKVLGQSHTKSHNTWPTCPTKLHNTHLVGRMSGGPSEWGLILREKFGTMFWANIKIGLDCLKPWSEDVVVTVDAVSKETPDETKTISLKIQKFKYLWDIDITPDDDGNTIVTAVEMPDPSTKYENGLVTTRYVKVPITKDNGVCWCVDTNGWDSSMGGITGVYHYLDLTDLKANKTIRKKG